MLPSEKKKCPAEIQSNGNIRAKKKGPPEEVQREERNSVFTSSQPCQLYEGKGKIVWKKEKKKKNQGQNSFFSTGKQGKTVTLIVCYQRKGKVELFFNDNYSNNHDTWLYHPNV